MSYFLLLRADSRLFLLGLGAFACELMYLHFTNKSQSCSCVLPAFRPFSLLPRTHPHNFNLNKWVTNLERGSQYKLKVGALQMLVMIPSRYVSNHLKGRNVFYLCFINQHLHKLHSVPSNGSCIAYVIRVQLYLTPPEIGIRFS